MLMKSQVWHNIFFEFSIQTRATIKIWLYWK